jgi:hypothetical protein
MIFSSTLWQQNHTIVTCLIFPSKRPACQCTRISSRSALTSSAWHFRLGLQPPLQFLSLTASLFKRKFMDAESSVTPDTLINLPLSVTDATVSGLSEHCSYKGADMVPITTAQNTKHKWGYVHICYFHYLAKADIFLGELQVPLQSYFTSLPPTEYILHLLFARVSL